jgi:oligopeptide/dipeptide ABC transporter ATP-binding protein
VEGLGVTLEADGERRPILTDVSFSIDAGETLGLVGESGSGKSMTARAIARLLPPGGTPSGQIRFDAVDVLALTGADLRAYRAEDIAMVFQDPRAHTNPVRRIGDFLTESMRERGTPAVDADARARALLHEVGLEDAEALMRRFPHEMSGGMLQRIMIAAALANEPRLLLADEPTTALDVTTQAEIIAIVRRLQRSHGLSVLFITHDLELAAATCDRICVMYAGTIVEVQRSDRLFRSPLHPYTAALLASRPDVRLRERAKAIPGHPISLFEAPPGCPFAPRCPFALPPCRDGRPARRPVDGGLAACIRTEEIAPGLRTAHEVARG